MDERLRNLYQEMVAVCQGLTGYDTLRLRSVDPPAVDMDPNSNHAHKLMSMLELHNGDAILGRLPEWWSDLSTHTIPDCTYAHAVSMMRDNGVRSGM